LERGLKEIDFGLIDLTLEEFTWRKSNENLEKPHSGFPNTSLYYQEYLLIINWKGV